VVFCHAWSESVRRSVHVGGAAGIGLARLECMNTKPWTHSLVALALAAACATIGCTATVREEPPVTTSAYVEVGPPIEHIRVAPEIMYEGHRVYWYGGHWYFRTGGHWAFYEHEPYALRGHRYVIRY